MEVVVFYFILRTLLGLSAVQKYLRMHLFFNFLTLLFIPFPCSGAPSLQDVSLSSPDVVFAASHVDASSTLLEIICRADMTLEMCTRLSEETRQKLLCRFDFIDCSTFDRL